MEPTTAIATGCDTGDLPSIEAIDKVFGCALGWNPDAYFPFCFSESHPYQVPAVRPKAKPKKTAQHKKEKQEKMNNDRHKYRIPFFDNSGKFIGFEDLDIFKGVQPYNAGVCHRGEPEQCIGLKDKNGKMIYNKDIVRVHWTDQKPTDFIVRWNSVQCCFDFNEYRNKRRGCKFLKWQLLFAFGKSEVVEIIGNIHEEQFRDATKKVEGEQC